MHGQSRAERERGQAKAGLLQGSLHLYKITAGRTAAAWTLAMRLVTRV
jgi:hypothetical protein